MPFGYANSPSIFVKYISKILNKMIKSGKIVVFIDDILVASESIEEHLEILTELFNILSDNLLDLNYEKCKFLKTRIDYLGYEVSHNQIQPSEHHIESVRAIPIPTSKKSLQRFLGLVSYFRKFIFQFNRIASPLYDLMKEGNEFNFTAIHIVAFNRLKEAIVSKPVLSIFSPIAETQLHTDASAAGFGAILVQRQMVDNQFHPVMFFSRRTSSSEAKLAS